MVGSDYTIVVKLTSCNAKLGGEEIAILNALLHHRINSWIDNLRILFISRFFFFFLTFNRFYRVYSIYSFFLPLIRLIHLKKWNSNTRNEKFPSLFSRNVFLIFTIVEFILKLSINIFKKLYIIKLYKKIVILQSYIKKLMGLIKNIYNLHFPNG